MKIHCEWPVDDFDAVQIRFGFLTKFHGARVCYDVFNLVTSRPLLTCNTGFFMC